MPKKSPWMNSLYDNKRVKNALAISGVEKRTSQWLGDNIGGRQMSTDDVDISKNLTVVVTRLRVDTPWRNDTTRYNEYNVPHNHALQEIENCNVYRKVQLDEFE